MWLKMFRTLAAYMSSYFSRVMPLAGVYGVSIVESERSGAIAGIVCEQGGARRRLAAGRHARRAAARRYILCSANLRDAVHG